MTAVRPLAPGDLAAYLARIGSGAGDDLAAVHLAHRYAVPFENLDIHLGAPVSLEPAALVDKVVGRRRGGFCYEQNLLFAGALAALGHDVTLVSAAMWDEEAGRFNPPFDHMALEVQTDDGPVLADVGSGRGILRPVPFDGTTVDRFRVVAAGDGWLLEHDGAPRYRFDRVARRPAEYAAMCRYHQTSPESPFTRGWLATLARPGGGRLTARGGLLLDESPAGRTERALDGPADLERVLVERFGMAPLSVPRALVRHRAKRPLNHALRDRVSVR